jgi:hypothetical protein
MAAEPSLRPAATKRPERSNLAREHWEGREAWTAVGYVILKGSEKSEFSKVLRGTRNEYKLNSEVFIILNELPSELFLPSHQQRV